MRNLIFVVLAFFLCRVSTAADVEIQCVAKLSGEEGIPDDGLGKIKLTKLRASPKGRIFAVIATEYIGAENLQATIYLQKHSKYCFAGDLGGAVDFKVDRSRVVGGLYSIEVISKSGDEKFSRYFAYQNKSSEYRLFSCYVKSSTGPRRRCTISEE